MILSSLPAHNVGRKTLTHRGSTNRGQASGIAWYCVATAVAFVVLFVLAALGVSRNPAFLPIIGLMQRLCLAVGFAWLTMLALRKMRQPGT